MSILLNPIWLVSLLLSTKVYATLAKALPAQSAAYAAAAAAETNETSKVSNYFRHQPYGPNTYAFGFEVRDPHSGNVQFRDERRYLNGSVEGSFGYVRPDGRIEVTHYQAGKQSGYLSETQSFAAGDERAAAVWPLSHPQILLEGQKTQASSNVSWDPISHLNVTVDAVADDVAAQLKQQHGLDLKHIDVEQDVLQPAVLDIISGKAPLKQQANGSLAFETVHNFIPKDFPIVPFALPPLSAMTSKEPTLENKINSSNEASNHKYNNAKANNAEKSTPMGGTKTPTGTAMPANSLPTPKSLVSSAAAPHDPNWYEKIIQANRREFLEQLPKLS